MEQQKILDQKVWGECAELPSDIQELILKGGITKEDIESHLKTLRRKKESKLDWSVLNKMTKDNETNEKEQKSFL